MRRQTDGQRQQDKKPHHLLLYLIDLISGEHNSGQKQKQKTQKSKKTKGKKQWVTVQQKNTTVDEAGTADGGGRWLDCWHLCASALITALHLLYNTVQLLLLKSHITISHDLQRNHLGIRRFSVFPWLGMHYWLEGWPHGKVILLCPP